MVACPQLMAQSHCLWSSDHPPKSRRLLPICQARSRNTHSSRYLTILRSHLITLQISAIYLYLSQFSSKLRPKIHLIMAGEWWDANPIDVVREATRTGAAPNVSDAYTINGQPGDLYKCSSNRLFPQTHQLPVFYFTLSEQNDSPKLTRHVTSKYYIRLIILHF